MKQAGTKLAAVLLTLAMIATVLPFAAFASDGPPVPPTEDASEGSTEESGTRLPEETTEEDPVGEETADPTETEALAARGIMPLAIFTDNDNYSFDSDTGVLTVMTDDGTTEWRDDSSFAEADVREVIIEDSVTSIGNSAFKDCDLLTNVIIPDSVTSIGDSAFWNCDVLTDVIIPDSVTSIGDFAFQDCAALTGVTIPNSVKTIGTQAFSGCDVLTEVTFGSGVTRIGSNAFLKSPLETITFTGHAPTIGLDAFKGVPFDVTITVPAGTKEAYASALTNAVVTELGDKFSEDDLRARLEETGAAPQVSGELTIGGNVYNLGQDYPDDPTWSWIAATATLTLKGYSGGSIVIDCNALDEINLVLEGDSNVNDGSSSTAITCDGSLVISGGGTVTAASAGPAGYGINIPSGSLTIKSGTVTATSANESGIYVAGLLSISGGTVNATSDSGSGIYVFLGAVTISDGIVNAEGVGSNAAGIRSVSGSVSIIDGTVKATNEDGSGIYADKGVTISDGTVTATGGDGSGIYVFLGDVTISGGTVTAEGAGGRVGGIESYSGSVSISGGNVTADGADAEASGIMASSGVSISGGTVDLSGTAWGISAPGSVSLSGGSGTIKGGEHAVLAGEDALNVSGVNLLGSLGGEPPYDIDYQIVTIDLDLGPADTFVDKAAAEGTYDDAVLRGISFSAIPGSRPDSDSEPESVGSDWVPSGDSESSYKKPVVLADDWLDPDEARSLAASAKRQNLDYARTFRANRYGVRGNAWAELRGLRFYHDTMLGGAVQVRVTFGDPSLLGEDARVSGYVTGRRADMIRALFERWFTNPVRTIHFDQAGDWEHPVRVAAKLDFTGWDTKRLFFYSYDPKTGIYHRLAAPEYWIDANGYVHFTTELAGEIIVSEGELEKR